MDAVNATVLQENKKLKMTIMGFSVHKILLFTPKWLGRSADLLLAVKNVKRAELVGLLQ